MEINKLGDRIYGVVPTANVVEGKFGLLGTHSWTYDFGSNTDLPGWHVPATIEEAKRAKYIITWAVTNSPTPFMYPMPHPVFSTRQGFGTAGNAPFAAGVYLTYPGNQDGQTIPSGVPSLAMNEGIFTVGVEAFIPNANLVAGAPVIVANTVEDGADAGKLKYQATMDERVVGFVVEYNSAAAKITVQTID